MGGDRISVLMMIDDNQIDQMLHRRIVERSGYVDKIISFLYADEALEYLKSDQSPRPNVILLDINMPRMDGFEFLDEVSKLPLEMSVSVVVMLTTSMDKSDEERASTYDSVKAFLNKPLSTNSLEAIAKL